MKNLQFDHERLAVYRTAIGFIEWVTEILRDIPKGAAVHNQLDRASTSIPLNIGEGTAKFTAPDRCRFFDSARGSAVECAACLDVAVAKGFVTRSQIEAGRVSLTEIVAMLIGLIRANDGSRFCEEEALYSASSSIDLPSTEQHSATK